jgi:hypothetical protein
MGHYANKCGKSKSVRNNSESSNDSGMYLCCEELVDTANDNIEEEKFDNFFDYRIVCGSFPPPCTKYDIPPVHSSLILDRGH